MAINSTNFSKPSQVNTGYGVFDPDTDVLLLQNGTDSLLLQNGSDKLLLGGSGEGPKSTNYSQPFT